MRHHLGRWLEHWLMARVERLLLEHGVHPWLLEVLLRLHGLRLYLIKLRLLGIPYIIQICMVCLILKELKLFLVTSWLALSSMGTLMRYMHRLSICLSY